MFVAAYKIPFLMLLLCLSSVYLCDICFYDINCALVRYNKKKLKKLVKFWDYRKATMRPKVLNIRGKILAIEILKIFPSFLLR